MIIDANKMLADICDAFGNTADLKTKGIKVSSTEVEVAYIDGLIDKELFEDGVMKPLSEYQGSMEDYKSLLNNHLYYSEKITTSKDFDEILDKIAGGEIAIIIDGAVEVYFVALIKYDKRSISEPPTANVLKGPREGFIEDFKTNMSLIRRRLKTPKLRYELITIGQYSNTRVAIGYIEGIASEGIIKEIRDKLSNIKVAGISDSSYVAKILENRSESFFKQIGASEKPDIVAAKMLEGRVAIIVDGSPMVLTVPFLLIEDLQDSHDYYSRPARATMARIIRVIGLCIALLLPALYVALQEYHYQLFPIKFLITLLNSVSAIPFTPVLETLIVLCLFEILNEASVRMPRYVGMAVSIVGAIVLGDTAVKSGLVSSSAVLVTAISSIGLYCVPDQLGCFSLLRLIYVCISAVLGLFGIMIAGIVTLAYTSNMETFGAPYLAPYAPYVSQDMKDTIFKKGMLDMQYRPFSFPRENNTRIKKK